MKHWTAANLISLITAFAAVWACWNKHQELNMTKWKAKNFQEFTEQHYQLKP